MIQRGIGLILFPGWATTMRLLESKVEIQDDEGGGQYIW